MALTVGINSYISISDANLLVMDLLDTDAWDKADDVKKQKALVEAANIIDSFRYTGRKLSTDQVMQFPRLDVNISLNDAQLIKYSLRNIEVPGKIKIAQVVQAIYLLEDKDSAMDMASKGVSSFSAGGASISFNSSVNEYSMLSPKAKQYLKPYLTKLGTIV